MLTFSPSPSSSSSFSKFCCWNTSLGLLAFLFRLLAPTSCLQLAGALIDDVTDVTDSADVSDVVEEDDVLAVA